MEILNKTANKCNHIFENKSPVIVFLGDSVTQGCFECYINGKEGIETIFDVDNSFSTKLKTMLALLYPKAVVNIINSGISGDNAGNGLNRMERDVFSYNPDLVVVGFALNDSCGGEEKLDEYHSNMSNIVKKIKEKNIECILLTPNFMNTKISPHLAPDLVEFAENFKDIQNGGVLDKYVDVIRDVAKDYDVPLCDMYAFWKNMAKHNVDTTSLLANYMNHPKREMNEITALKLLECMLEN